MSETAEQISALPHLATTAEIRAWARENGHTVGTRGFLPKAVREAYAAAHASA